MMEDEDKANKLFDKIVDSLPEQELRQAITDNHLIGLLKDKSATSQQDKPQMVVFLMLKILQIGKVLLPLQERNPVNLNQLSIKSLKGIIKTMAEKNSISPEALKTQIQSMIKDDFEAKFNPADLKALEERFDQRELSLQDYIAIETNTPVMQLVKEYLILADQEDFMTPPEFAKLMIDDQGKRQDFLADVIFRTSVLILEVDDDNKFEPLSPRAKLAEIREKGMESLLKDDSLSGDEKVGLATAFITMVDDKIDKLSQNTRPRGRSSSGGSDSSTSTVEYPLTSPNPTTAASLEKSGSSQTSDASKKDSPPPKATLGNSLRNRRQ